MNIRFLKMNHNILNTLPSSGGTLPGSDSIIQVYMCIHLKLTFLSSSKKPLYKAKNFLIIIIKSDKLEH